MNNGAFGENFPYSNFHDLNMDWIIKIAKDFLDQYTNIQQTITEGLEGLDNKAQELEALLQQWYDTHSEDIANQLADALNDLNNWYTTHEGYLNQYLADSITAFNNAADQKAAQTIASIPADYTTLSDNVNKNNKILFQDDLQLASLANTLPMKRTAVSVTNTSQHYWKNVNGIATNMQGSVSYYASNAIPVSPGEIYEVSAISGVSINQSMIMIVDQEYNVIYESTRPNANTEYNGHYVIPNNAAYLLVTSFSKGATVYKVEYDKISGADMTPVSLVVNNGTFWNSEGTTAILESYQSYSSYNPIDITPGSLYSVYIYHGQSAKQDPVLFVDDNYTIIEKLRWTTGVFTLFEGYVPDGATKMLLTTSRVHSNETIYKTDIEPSKPWQMLFNGKRIAIIGDSISTNGNYSVGNPFGNVPEIIITEEDVGVTLSAYVTYYDVGKSIGGHTIVTSDIGTELTFTPISDDVGKTVGQPDNYNDQTTKVWWEVMQDSLNFNPIPVCWSGASMTSHESNSDRYKTSYAWHDAQIRKCGIRTPGTMNRVAPDVIIIYRGTNDFSHAPYAKLTEGYFNNPSWDYPETDAIDNGYGYLEAIALTVKKLRTAYPEAKIFLSTLNIFKRVIYDSYPTRNGETTLPAYCNAIRDAANFLGCGLIEFDKDGITFENCYISGYITDSQTTPTHPNNKGHKVMGNKAIIDMMKQCNSMT